MRHQHLRASDGVVSPVFVGANFGGWIGPNSGSSTVSLTALTGGIDTAARSGDLVIAVYAVASAIDASLTITDGSTNYTLIASELYVDSSYDVNLRVAYKRLTSADASVTFGPTGASGNGGAGIVYVWRGVHATTPLDVTPTTATGTTGGGPNPPAITPVTPGAVVIAAGAGAAFTAPTLASSDLSGVYTMKQADSNDPTVLVGYKNWDSGSFDPAAFTGYTGNGWAALTLALRPA